MSNHLNGIDYGVIVYTLAHYTKNKKKIFAIAKHNVFGDKTDKNIVSNSLTLIKDQMFNLLNIIPYERDNKKSGDKVKKIMLDKIGDGDTVLFDNDMNITHRFTPKKNSMVWFDYKTIHACENQLSSPNRCVINFNFIVR